MATHGTNMRARSAGDKRVTISSDNDMERELLHDRMTGDDKIVRLPNPSRPALSRSMKSAGRKALTCR